MLVMHRKRVFIDQNLNTALTTHEVTDRQGSKPLLKAGELEPESVSKARASRKVHPD